MVGRKEGIGGTARNWDSGQWEGGKGPRGRGEGGEDDIQKGIFDLIDKIILLARPPPGPALVFFSLFFLFFSPSVSHPGTACQKYVVLSLVRSLPTHFPHFTHSLTPSLTHSLTHLSHSYSHLLGKWPRHPYSKDTTLTHTFLLTFSVWHTLSTLSGHTGWNRSMAPVAFRPPAPFRPCDLGPCFLGLAGHNTL